MFITTLIFYDVLKRLHVIIELKIALPISEIKRSVIIKERIRQLTAYCRLNVIKKLLICLPPPGNVARLTLGPAPHDWVIYTC